MTLSPGFRKFVLTAHVATSVGFVGAVATFLVLAVAGFTAPDTRTVSAAYIANDVIAWYVILPLSFAALVTGLTQSLGTSWGLFRHWWVLVKLLLTVFTIFVLLNQMRGISYAAAAAVAGAMSDPLLSELRLSFLIHAGGGLLVALTALILSVYKPRGLTRYGRRKRPRSASQCLMRIRTA